jgi:hypothetical protein
VREFVSQWFTNSPQDGEQVIDGLRARGWPSFATNPLLLTLTCACIPVRGELPKRASDLYGRFLSFILEQWDPIRRISDRPPVPTLTPDIAIRLLAEIALAFHSKHRTTFARTQVVAELARQISLLGPSPPEPYDLFVELTKRHGLLRSWSIDQHYAFPHLSLQAYLAARALRSRADSHRIIIEHKNDPFRFEAICLYAELGDITEAARELLTRQDNILASNLCLVAECLAAGGEIADARLRGIAIERLIRAAKEKNRFLADKAATALARIDVPEAKRAFVEISRDDKGNFTRSAATRFVVSVFGQEALEDVVAQLLRTGSDENLLENFASLPRRVAVERLLTLILNTNWPTERDLGYDPAIRHLRRDAELLIARVGEELAIPILIQLMSASQLSSYEKAGCVTALASIDDPSVPGILRSIV